MSEFIRASVMDCPSRCDPRYATDRRALPLTVGPSRFSTRACHFVITFFKLVKDGFRVVDAAAANIGYTTRNGGIGGRKKTLAGLQQPESITHHFAGIIVSPAGKLGLNERLETRSQG